MASETDASEAVYDLTTVAALLLVVIVALLAARHALMRDRLRLAGFLLPEADEAVGLPSPEHTPPASITLPREVDAATRTARAAAVDDAGKSSEGSGIDTGEDDDDDDDDDDDG